MPLTKKEIKQKYFEKVYNNAQNIECACGCGIIIKNKDKFGRDKKYVSGHNGRKYSDPTQYKREHHKKMRDEKARIKAWLIIEMGGECMICGYQFDGRNNAAFDFHHRDSDTKEFNVSKISKTKEGLEKMLKEAKLCDVLCATCHRLTHSGYFD